MSGFNLAWIMDLPPCVPNVSVHYTAHYIFFPTSKRPLISSTRLFTQSIYELEIIESNLKDTMALMQTRVTDAFLLSRNRHKTTTDLVSTSPNLDGCLSQKKKKKLGWLSWAVTRRHPHKQVSLWVLATCKIGMWGQDLNWVSHPCTWNTGITDAIKGIVARTCLLYSCQNSTRKLPSLWAKCLAANIAKESERLAYKIIGTLGPTHYSPILVPFICIHVCEQTKQNATFSYGLG